MVQRKRGQPLKPAGPQRPLPPAEFADVSFVTRFAPAPELAKWARETFIEEGGALYNPDHRHLLEAGIGFVWASDGYVKQGRRVLGLTEKIQIIGNPWAKGRAEQQLGEWFGRVPEFLITLDGFHCGQCDDVDFCALVEHELYHVGHATDEFGAPAFTKEGRPKLAMRGHDVEEFVGVVRRYGVGDPDSSLARLIIAAAQGPTVDRAKISHACGVCIKLAA